MNESKEMKQLNRDLIIGWLAIVVILFVSYTGEVLKNQRTGLYLLEFTAVTAIPAIICLVLYLVKEDFYRLRYCIVVGYFAMYVFVMLTGSTILVFTYILPLLSFLVLYHQPKLILATGLASFVVNAIVIWKEYRFEGLTLANSKEVEIQVALLALCFIGSYVATVIYDKIHRKNVEYVRVLDEKNEQIEKMAFQTITTIANTIDAKDEYTQGHSRRVAEYSSALARELGWDEEKCSNIKFVALLHDIGKIGIPDSVLNKPGKLTDQEYFLMRQHTVIGADILKDIKLPEGIDVGAKYHHERYDGKGYPSGLAGEEIPEIARIIGVCDAYDAMTTNRIYRKRLDEARVLEELKNGLGKQFDPKAGAAMIRLIEEKRLVKPDAELTGMEDGTAIILSRILEKQEHHLDEEAYLDKLTKAYVKTYGQELLAAEVTEHAGCFMIVDVDHLKHINVSEGYLAGDLCLYSVAEGLRKAGPDLLIRYAGDKFAVWNRNLAKREDADENIRRMLESVKNELADGAGFPEVTVSVGVVLVSASEKPEVGELFQHAEKVLYQVKESGGEFNYFHKGSEYHEEPVRTKADMRKISKLIKNENFYEGGLKVSLPEFGKIYEYIHKIAARNNSKIQFLMFTLLPIDESNYSVEDQEKVMDLLELAVVHSIRGVDVTTRYSSLQRIVVLMNSPKEQVHVVTERITKEFYKIYPDRQFSLFNDSLDLDEE